MSRTTTFLTTFAIAGVLVLGACSRGQNEGEMAEPITDEEAGLPEEPGLGEEPATAPIEVGLEAKAESGITGTATLTPIADGVEVNLDAQGLTDGETYAAHLHRGTCDNDQGVVAPLEDVIAAGESGQSTTTIGRSMLDPNAKSLFVQLHGANGDPVACGNVPEDAGLTELKSSTIEPGAIEPGAAQQPAQGTDEYR